jgi:GT2 family glycosyltransferase/glycosyltransferase involved in cell wall biosynthesis
VHFCTVINRSWVAHARALGESVRTHEPSARTSVLIVDPLEGLIDPAQESFEILSPEDLAIDDFEAMSVRYGVTELCCSLKPFLLRHLLEREGTVVYLDSDVRLFAPFDGLREALEANSVLLTPHLLEPLPEDGYEPGELAILLAGAFNMGVIAARSGPKTDALLSWWADRLRTGSRLDPARGMVYDQRWAELMPGMFESVGVWRDPGVNFGYWRVVTTSIERSAGTILVDGQPLRCLHFTGYDPDEPDRLSKFENRTKLEHEPVLKELSAEYAQRLDALGDAEAKTWPYGYGSMSSGAPLDGVLRELWDRAARVGAVRQTPFTPEGERAFLTWLAEDDQSVSGEPLNRYLEALHRANETLRKRFPNPHDADRSGYLAWAKEQAEREPTSVLGLLLASERKVRAPGLRRLAVGEGLGASRGETVVCIPVYGARELFAECLRSVLEHTGADLRILIADDASPDPGIEALLVSIADAGGLAEHELIYMRQPSNLGFPGNVNSAFAAASPADVIVLNSDCVVAAGWLEGLRRAAYSDGLVATASALTNHGTILSVPERNHPLPGLPQDKDLTRAAEAVRAQSLRLYPRLPTAVGHCMYVRRHALELVGDFDDEFSPGYGEEVDFSQRCLLHGLVHVAADDVLVLHHARGSLGEDGERNPVQAEHERIIEARYPYYPRAQTAASESPVGPLPRALGSARRAIRGLTATIDARCLGPIITGTQIHTLEIIRALDHTGRVRIRVIVPPDLGGHARKALAAMPDVESIPHTDVHPAMSKSDVAHRPYQVSDPNDLVLLRCAGERVVITHQDLIAYRNPGYFAGYPNWERYQRLTREALALADTALFFSHHAAVDAVKEDLVDLARVRVVYIGVDHADAAPSDVATAPPGVRELGDRPMLLCLGTDFRHKNRLFAIRLLETLRGNHGWDGMLVLAGPRVNYGSSAGEEAAFLLERPELAKFVLTLPAVSEGEKAWLLERCSAVLYPTTYEGFGLMPFEAAASGRPCLFATHTALAETLPGELSTLVPWDPRESAKRVDDLLSTPGAAAEQVLAIRQAGKRFTWQSAGESIADAYLQAATSPGRDATRLATEAVKLELQRAESERKYNELWGALTEDSRTLLAPDGALTPETTHSLVAIVNRPLLRRLLLGSLHIAYKLTGAARRNPVPEPPETTPASFALHFADANLDHMREQLAVSDDDSLLADR